MVNLQSRLQQLHTTIVMLGASYQITSSVVVSQTIVHDTRIILEYQKKLKQCLAWFVDFRNKTIKLSKHLILANSLHNSILN